MSLLLQSAALGSFGVVVGFGLTDVASRLAKVAVRREQLTRADAGEGVRKSRAALAVTAGLIVALTWHSLPPPLAIPAITFGFLLLVGLAVDLDCLLLPDEVTFGACAAGIIFGAAVPSLHGVSAEIPIVAHMKGFFAACSGAAVGSGLILWLALIAEKVLRKECFGFGDVKLMGAIGAFCGWQGAVFALFGGAFVGIGWVVSAVVWQALFRRRAPFLPRVEDAEGRSVALELQRNLHVPFGPMLSVAAFAYLVWAKPHFESLLIVFTG